MYDYQSIDKQWQYQQRQDRLESARKLGFEYISEATVKVYRETKSSTKTGKLLGGLTSQAVCQFLSEIGEPRNPRGGWNEDRARTLKENRIKHRES